MIETLAILFTGLCALFVVFNLAAAIAFRLFPRFVATPQERKRYSYISRFEGELAKYVPAWFAVEENQTGAFFAEYAKHELNIYEHEPFSEFKHPGREGSFINYAPQGYRHNREKAPWPPADDCFNVFFFGGSTTLAVGPDWTTIPSKLQDLMNASGQSGRRVNVYNFGRGSFFSSMEITLFQNLLREGRRPDLVIFLDGINDSYFFNGLPPTYGLFHQAVVEMNEEVAAETRSRMRSRPKWNLFQKFFATLPSSRLFDVIASSIAQRGAASPLTTAAYDPLTDDQKTEIIERYKTNMGIAESICAKLGMPLLFAWQPTPSYGYDLNNHVALASHFGLQGHERSGEVTEVLASHAPLRDNKNFLWLADLQDQSTDALYVDTVHYTDAFCATIARSIFDALGDRGLTGADTKIAEQGTLA